jgi:hypothetical protein
MFVPILLRLEIFIPHLSAHDTIDDVSLNLSKKFQILEFCDDRIISD